MLNLCFGAIYSYRCEICNAVSRKKVCGYHKNTNEPGEIIEPNNARWGKDDNNDFHLILPPTNYQEKAGSKCWLLVDHCQLKGQYTFVMFLWEINNKFLPPFVLKLRENMGINFNFDIAIQMVAELGIEPVGLVGDTAFSTVFKASPPGMFFLDVFILRTLTFCLNALYKTLRGHRNNLQALI